MPIFEYKCDDCGEEFEEIVLGSGEAEIPCPKCKSVNTAKLMSRCRHKSGGAAPDLGMAPEAPSGGGSGCAGCTGGDCSSCG